MLGSSDPLAELPVSKGSVLEDMIRSLDSVLGASELKSIGAASVAEPWSTPSGTCPPEPFVELGSAFSVEDATPESTGEESVLPVIDASTGSVEVGAAVLIADP